MVSKELRSAWRFFCEHAGYATPPGRAVCALELARAEDWIRTLEADGEATIEWWPDEEWWAWQEEIELDCDPPREVLVCVLGFEGRFASLGGIMDPTPEYERVVVAELASELMREVYAAVPQL